MTDNFDLRYNNFPVCPYCGEENTDCDELENAPDDENEASCSECEKTYFYRTETSRTFDTFSVEDIAEHNIQHAKTQIKNLEDKIKWCKDNGYLQEHYKDELKYWNMNLKKNKELLENYHD